MMIADRNKNMPGAGLNCPQFIGAAFKKLGCQFPEVDRRKVTQFFLYSLVVVPVNVIINILAYKQEYLTHDNEEAKFSCD